MLPAIDFGFKGIALNYLYTKSNYLGRDIGENRTPLGHTQYQANYSPLASTHGGGEGLTFSAQNEYYNAM